MTLVSYCSRSAAARPERVDELAAKGVFGEVGVDVMSAGDRKERM